MVADKGFGKSTLLTELQQRTGDEIRLCFIDAQQHTVLPAIIGQCLVCLGVSSHKIETAEYPIQVFKHRLAQLRQSSITPVMLIDNAEELNVALRTELARWL